MTIIPDIPLLAESLSGAEWRDAGKMGLRYEARSPEALRFVQGLLDDVVLPAWPEGTQRRPASVEASRRALGALLADLLKFEADRRAGACGTSPKDFTGLNFGRDIFIRVRDALQAAGLLKVQPGRQQLHNWTNHATGAAVVTSGGGFVSRFRLTPKALELARGLGVDRGDYGTHWGRPTTAKSLKPSKAPLLVVRAKAERVYGVRNTGANLPVDATDPKAAAFLQDLKEHNAFLMATGVGGFAFAGLRRIFSNGDRPGFAWQWGGRFYSLPGGEQYEALSGEARRDCITLGGAQVGEADIRASHLSILYALKGLPFDPGAFDPYAIGGLERDVVKLWVAQTIGRDSVTGNRWSPKARQRFGELKPGRELAKDYPIADVRETVLAVHPVLRALGSPDAPTSLDLQFHESEILRDAMAALRHKGIPSLPVHDSLVAPVDALQDAGVAMKDAFGGYVERLTGKPCSVAPAVQLKGLDDPRAELCPAEGNYHLSPSLKSLPPG